MNIVVQGIIVLNYLWYWLIWQNATAELSMKDDKINDCRKEMHQSSLELTRLNNYVRQVQADNYAQDQWKNEQQKMKTIVQV